MIIEIRKAGFVNKGAQLMLTAVLQQLDTMGLDYELAMAPNPVSAPFKARALHGSLQKASYWRKGLQFGGLVRLFPKSVREMYGVVTDKDVDVIIDISGFGYSDKNGVGGCVELAQQCRKARKDAKIILLPQALGPFRKPLSRWAMRQVVKRADLIFARDEESYRYLTDVAGKADNIHVCPDFTNLLEGVASSNTSIPHQGIAIVASGMMIERSDAQTGAAYVDFLVNATKFLVEAGAKPFFLIHEGPRDRLLAETIVQQVDGEISIVSADDPLEIKWILGTCRGTIGGRFHGLVSALSQGVPSFGIGWAHKYEHLFRDYGFPEGLLDPRNDWATNREKIRMLIDEEAHQRIRSTLVSKNAFLKDQVLEMWAQACRVITGQNWSRADSAASDNEF